MVYWRREGQPINRTGLHVYSPQDWKYHIGFALAIRDIAALSVRWSRIRGRLFITRYRLGEA